MTKWLQMIDFGVVGKKEHVNGEQNTDMARHLCVEVSAAGDRRIS